MPRRRSRCAGTDGKTHKLSDYKGKEVVVAWYPAAGTPGCTAECKSFHANGPAIKAYDVAYFMASVDTPERNLEFAKVTEADFPLLSDPAKATATSYGVLGGRGQREPLDVLHRAGRQDSVHREDGQRGSAPAKTCWRSWPS